MTTERLRYEHVLAFVLEHPWAVTRPMLTMIASILARRMAGDDVSRTELEAAMVRKNLPQPKQGAVGVIPIYGVIAPRMNLFSDMSGGTSYEQIRAQLADLVADPTISTIVLDVDSPGGSVAGSAEAFADIRSARAQKPIVAVAQYAMASAAYHLGSAATEIVAAPSARVGSIGVFAIHNDMSEALAKLGVKRTFIAAGEGKTEGNDSQPLSDAAYARISGAVQDAYDQFVSNVVKGRGGNLTNTHVKQTWQAHTYSATEALSLGMIDSIGTLESTVQRLTGASPTTSALPAATDDSSPSRDTAQEPSPATAQDRARVLDRQRTTVALLDW